MSQSPSSSSASSSSSEIKLESGAPSIVSITMSSSRSASPSSPSRSPTRIVEAKDDTKITDAIREGDVDALDWMLRDRPISPYLIEELMIEAVHMHQMPIINYFINHPNDTIRKQARDNAIEYVMSSGGTFDMLRALIRMEAIPITQGAIIMDRVTDHSILGVILSEAILSGNQDMMYRLIGSGVFPSDPNMAVLAIKFAYLWDDEGFARDLAELWGLDYDEVIADVARGLNLNEVFRYML